MLTGQVGGPTAGCVEQGTQAREGAAHVVACERAGEHPRRHVEQEVHVRVRNVGDVGGLAVEGLVGQSEIDLPARLGEQEDEPVRLPGHRDHERRVTEFGGLGVQHEVRATGRTQPHARHQLARPHPGRVDHLAGSQLDGLAGQLVTGAHALGRQLQCSHPREDPGAEPRGRPGERHHQPCVVGEGSVEGEQTAAEPGLAQRGHECERLSGRHRAGPGQQ